MSRATYGKVEVTVGERTYALSPTLQAMDKIQHRWPQGGLQAAIAACAGMNPRDLAYVISAGAGLSAQESKDIVKEVFDAGCVLIAAPVIEYLSLLMNPTGKEPTAAAESEPGE